MSRAGGLKLGVFVRLNASRRNSALRAPPMLTRFARAALPEWQLVARREHEVVPDIEERRPVVPLRLVRVHPVRAFSLHAARAVVPKVVGADPAERVRREVLETFGATLAGTDLQCV